MKIFTRGFLQRPKSDRNRTILSQCSTLDGRRSPVLRKLHSSKSDGDLKANGPNADDGGQNLAEIPTLFIDSPPRFDGLYRIHRS
jgi:hypothetical protein